MTKSKKATTKAVVGSSTNKSAKKSPLLTRRTALFGLVGVMAFSLLGGWGWQKWDEHNLKAKAAGWTYVYGDKALTYVCKTPSQIKFYLVIRGLVHIHSHRQLEMLQV